MQRSYDWDKRKDYLLQKNKDRGIGFDDIVECIQNGGLLNVELVPNQVMHPGQKMYVINCKNYVYAVPYEKRGRKIRLITIFPSRKLTEKYLTKNKPKI